MAAAEDPKGDEPVRQRLDELREAVDEEFDNTPKGRLAKELLDAAADRIEGLDARAHRGTPER